VKVLASGLHRAKGQEKDKGVIVRWGLKEAQAKSAGPAKHSPDAEPDQGCAKCVGSHARSSKKNTFRHYPR